MSSFAETKDQLSWLQYGYNKKKEYFSNDRNRWIENAKMYWGVDYAQWPLQVVQQLLDEGRQAPTFNVMAYKMDGLRGSLLRNQFEMKYTPIDGESDDWSLKLQAMYYSDRDNMNWDWSYDIFLRNFLIQFGAEWMYIDTTQSPFGNIAFKADEFPHNLFPDPNWKTPLHKDLMELDRAAFYTAKQLRAIYPDKARELNESYMRQKYASRYQNKDIDYKFAAAEIGPSYQQLDQRWDATQLVIERHEIIQEVRDWEYNLRDGEWLPETGHDPQSMDDMTAKKHYIEQRGLSADDIKFLPQKNRRYHITTGCPVLDVTLEDRDSIIQIGSIPCFISGPAKMGTQYRGLADTAKDIQLNINKYMMMMSEILNKSARGSFFINEDIVQADSARMQQVERQWNNSAARIWVKPLDPNMIDKYVKEVPSSHIPNDLMAFHGLMNDYADRLTYQTPAAEGRSEGKKETNALFESKFEAHMIARGAIDTMLQIHEHGKAEAYLTQAKITYSGVPRTFADKSGKGTFEINVPKPGGMEWDISQASRQKVLIVPSQKGIDVRINQRGVFVQLKQATQDPLMAAVYDGHITKTVEMVDEDKEEAMTAIELVKKEAATAKLLNIANMEAQLQQIQNPQQMGADQQSMMAGAEGASAPPGAAPSPFNPGAAPNMAQGATGTPLQEQMSKKQLAPEQAPTE